MRTEVYLYNTYIAHGKHAVTMIRVSLFFTKSAQQFEVFSSKCGSSKLFQLLINVLCLFQGAIDRNQYLSSSHVAKKLIRSLLKNDYSTANELDTVLFHSLNNERFINFNNVYGQSPYPALERLNTKVNMYLKPTLVGVNQSRTWQYLSTTVYDNLKESFLFSSTSFCMY